MKPTELGQFAYENRKEYIDAQIARSKDKFGYCKVFFQDVIRYRLLLLADLVESQRKLDPILCLGVRSGAEVDIFRAVFFSPLMKSHLIRNQIVARDTTKHALDKTRLSRYVRFGAGTDDDGRVLGVELNPDSVRPDVRIGSFDELPDDWTGRFKLIFSNSFDHSQDPNKTIREWKRVAAPGAYLIIAFPADNTPTETDPLGKLSLDSVRDFVKAEIVFASETLNRTGYHEICFRLPG